MIGIGGLLWLGGFFILAIGGFVAGRAQIKSEWPDSDERALRIGLTLALIAGLMIAYSLVYGLYWLATLPGGD